MLTKIKLQKKREAKKFKRKTKKKEKKMIAGVINMACSYQSKYGYQLNINSQLRQAFNLQDKEISRLKEKNNDLIRIVNKLEKKK